MGYMKSNVLPKLNNDIDKYFREWGVAGSVDGFFSEQLDQIAWQFVLAAQSRSPYLYGVLHDAHTVSQEDPHSRTVHIDPNVTHPIMGGQPYTYGYQIHQYGQSFSPQGSLSSVSEPRPWFSQTVESDGNQIVMDNTGSLGDVVADVFTGNMAFNPSSGLGGASVAAMAGDLGPSTAVLTHAVHEATAAYIAATTGDSYIYIGIDTI